MLIRILGFLTERELIVRYKERTTGRKCYRGLYWAYFYF